jgi:hypothetical protein
MGHIIRPPKAQSPNRTEGFSLLAGDAYVPTVFVGMYAPGRWARYGNRTSQASGARGWAE